MYRPTASVCLHITVNIKAGITIWIDRVDTTSMFRSIQNRTVPRFKIYQEININLKRLYRSLDFLHTIDMKRRSFVLNENYVPQNLVFCRFFLKYALLFQDNI